MKSEIKQEHRSDRIIVVIVSRLGSCGNDGVVGGSSTGQGSALVDDRLGLLAT